MANGRGSTPACVGGRRRRSGTSGGGGVVGDQLGQDHRAEHHGRAGPRARAEPPSWRPIQLASVGRSPDFSIALPSANAAAITMMTSRSTARRASPGGQDAAGDQDDRRRPAPPAGSGSSPRPATTTIGEGRRGRRARPFRSRRRRAAHAGDQEEVVPIPPAVAEVRVGEQQQRVAQLERAPRRAWR